MDCLSVFCWLVGIKEYQWMPPLMQYFLCRVNKNPWFGCDLKAKHLDAHNGSTTSLSSDSLSPNVVIGSGRTTVALCASLKAMSTTKKKPFNIQIQHPRIPLSFFDAVVTPRHDFLLPRHLRRRSLPSNVHPTLGTVHHMSRDALVQEGKAWTHEWKGLLRKKHVLAVLIGGSCRGYPFSMDQARNVLKQILHLVHSPTHSAADTALLLTFSRRTPPEVHESSIMWARRCHVSPYSV